MIEPLAFLNGSLVPQAQAALPLHDAGFVFGATVTDLCRTFQHRLYRWQDHLARFRQSCTAAQILATLDDSEITRQAADLVAHNAKLIRPSEDLALVLFATPGPIGYYLGESGSAGDRPTFGMHTFALPFMRYRRWIEHGVHLVTPEVRQVPCECVDPHIKQRSRLHWWLAAKQVGDNAQALLLDMKGNVTETASSNFLLVKGGRIVSPRRESILDGVSFKVVRELCGRLGIPIEYHDMTLDECYAADEALLTCTSYCIAGVAQINDRVLPWPGPMLRRLVEAWSAEVGVDIHKQIMANSSCAMDVNHAGEPPTLRG